MNRGLLSVLIFILHGVSYAQVYEIPFADEQPDWVFPIWLEDGSGQRDTLYVAFDSDGATTFAIPSIDTIFGEILVEVDSSKFFAGWYGLSSQATTYKALVYRFAGNENDRLFFYNATSPVKISWDISLLYDADIPYPQINSMLPRAWVEIRCTDFSIFYQNCLAFEEEILATDTFPYTFFDPLKWVVDEKIFVYDTSWGEVHQEVGFAIQKWNYGIVSEISSPSINESIDISPNPATDFLNINLPSSYLLELYSNTGQLVYKTDSFGPHRIDLSGFSSGMYYLKIVDQQYQRQLYEKFYKP